MDYCNRIERFINYTLSNPKNISGGNIKCPYMKNKKFLDILLQYIFYKKKLIDKYLCWFTHIKQRDTIYRERHC